MLAPMLPQGSDEGSLVWLTVHNHPQLGNDRVSPGTAAFSQVESVGTSGAGDGPEVELSADGQEEEEVKEENSTAQLNLERLRLRFKPLLVEDQPPHAPSSLSWLCMFEPTLAQEAEYFGTFAVPRELQD